MKRILESLPRIMTIFLIVAILPTSSMNHVYSLTIEEIQEEFPNTITLIRNGNYDQANKIYDEMLEIIPDNILVLKMKGIVTNNVGDHVISLKQFYKILQQDPNDVDALIGMGIGMGYLGEYDQAKKYFERAEEINPNSIVIKNYKEFVDRVITKYPYTPTEKPQPYTTTQPIKIPKWIKTTILWWHNEEITDSEFIRTMEFLINEKIMIVPSYKVIADHSLQNTTPIPDSIKDKALFWIENQSNNKEFLPVIQYMIEQGIVNIQKSPEEIQKIKELEYEDFEKYLRKISLNVEKEKRYIEYPNPSNDVVKKFLRDQVRWNFEQEVRSSAKNFPDPTYEIIEDTYVIHYKIFVNDQPTGLPLDHTSTLKDALSFWEARDDFSVNNKNAKIEFEYTNLQHEANVWVTWVVRELCTEDVQERQIRQGNEPCKANEILGHAHVGKGVVEVTLGDFNCDGSFQLYDVETVKEIMTHELGHSIGLGHTSNPQSIMYPSLNPDYAYCLLGEISNTQNM